MKCSNCGENLDHALSYMFLVDGHTMLMCDHCREAYLKAQEDLAMALLKEARAKRKLVRK